ncbi:MAG: MFS transporter [Firmicutes bacterium]|nr:MFS transporter [Bacillota bacterium]
MRIPKSWGMTPDLWWLAASLGLWGLGFGLYGILWPLYIEKLGGTAVSVGLLSTLAGMTTAFVVFPGGWLADRIDRRTLILVGWLISMPAPFLYALAPNWHWLIPAMLLYYGSSFSSPAIQAIVLTESPSESMASAYNIVMSIFGAGMILGPTVGGYLAGHFSYRLVFVVSGIIYAGSTVLLLPMRPHPPQSRNLPAPVRKWRPSDRPRLFQWMMFSAGMAAVQGMVGPFIVPYWKSVSHFSMQTIGFLGSIGMLSGTVAAPFWGRIGQRMGIPQAIGWGMGIATSGLMVLIWNPASWTFSLFSGILRGVGESARSLQGVAIGRTVRRQEAGTAYGLMSLVTETVGALAPIPGGLLFHAWPYAPLLLSAFLTTIIGGWLISGLPGRPRPVPRTPR